MGDAGLERIVHELIRASQAHGQVQLDLYRCPIGTERYRKLRGQVDRTRERQNGLRDALMLALDIDRTTDEGSTDGID